MKLIIAIFGLIATVTAWDSVVSNFLSKVISKDSTLNIDNHALAFCGYEKHQCDTAPYCIWDVQSQICKRIVSPVPEQNLNSNFTQFASNYTNSTSNSTVGYNSTFLLESEFAAVNCTNQTFQNCSRINGCAWNYTYNFCQLNNTRKFFLEQNSTSNYTNSTTGFNRTFYLESEFAAVNCTNQTFQNCSRTSGCAWNYTYNFCQLNNTRKFFLESEYAAVNCTNQTFQNCSRTSGCAWNYTYNFCQLNNTRKFFLESEYAAVNCTNQTFQNCSRTNGCAWNYTYNFCQLNNTRKFFLESEYATVNCTNQTFQNCSRTNGCAWNYTYNFCQLNNTRKFVLEQNSTSNYTNSTSGYNYTFTLESQQFAAVNCTNQTFYNCSKFNGCAWNYTRNICQLNNTRQFFLEQSNSTNSTGSFNVTLFDFNSFNYTVNSTQTGAQNFNLSSSYINQTESAFRLCNELNKTQCIYANNCKWARNNSCIYNNSTLQVPFVHKLLSLERD